MTFTSTITIFNIICNDPTLQQYLAQRHSIGKFCTRELKSYLKTEINHHLSKVQNVKSAYCMSMSEMRDKTRRNINYYEGIFY